MLKIAFACLTVLFLAACVKPPQVVNTPQPTIDVTPSPTMITAITATITAAPQATTTVPSAEIPTIPANPEPSRPTTHLIAPITGERQAYALSCESRAAVDWAAYYGSDILEAEFQFNLPFSDNPDLGFVGVTTGKWGQVPPYDYGVHAAPVAELLRGYDVPAVAVKDFDLNSLKDLIAEGHPILTWVIGNVEGGVPHVYTDSLGNSVTVAAYEHVVIVIGYDDERDTITYMNNGRYYETSAAVFDNSWSVLERMAIYYENEQPGQP
jgi:uncharacterized protein YvpB